RPAAWIRHALGLCDGLRLAAIHLSESVGPAIRHPMGGRGIDHPRRIVLDQRYALARGIVGQAPNGDVGGVQELGAGRWVLAPLRRNRNELDVLAPGKPRAYLQPRRAVLTVDEDFCRHGLSPEKSLFQMVGAESGINPETS